MGVIANASDWIPNEPGTPCERSRADWQEAAERWRDERFHPLLRAASPPDSEPNQCDGCRRGLPVKDGMHVDQDELPFMVCSADRYDYEPPERCGDCGKLVLDLSQHDCGVGDEPAEGEGDGVIHEAAPISPAAWEAAGSVTPSQRRDALEAFDMIMDAMRQVYGAGNDLPPEHYLDDEIKAVRRALSEPAPTPDGGEGALLDDPLVDDLHDVLNELKAFADQGAERTADPVGARSRIGWLSRAIRRALSAGVPEAVRRLPGQWQEECDDLLAGDDGMQEYLRGKRDAGHELDRALAQHREKNHEG